MQTLLARLRSRRGQNTVEYLLMLSVIVGVSLALGRLFKTQIAGVFTNVIDSVRTATDQLKGG